MRAGKWILSAAMLGIALLAAGNAWHRRQQDDAFEKLPPGERQLAIYDAFAKLVEQHYYDRRFIAEDWPTLRDEWRTRVAATHDDEKFYLDVMTSMSFNFPASHVRASPPATLFTASKAAKSPAALAAPAPTGRGFDLSLVRRGGITKAFVGNVWPASPASEAGIEPGWEILSLPNGNSATEIGVF